MKETEYKLVEFNKEDGDKLAKDIEEVLGKHSAQFYIHQTIDKGLIGAVLQLYKKVPNAKEDNTETHTEKSS